MGILTILLREVHYQMYYLLHFYILYDIFTFIRVLFLMTQNQKPNAHDERITNTVLCTPPGTYNNIQQYNNNKDPCTCGARVVSSR